MQAAGIPIQEALLATGDFRQQGGYVAMQKLLNQPVRPRALLIANNLMTLGALQAINEYNVRIPEDLAIICFDDMPWATSLRPPLTAVAQPAEDLGREAARLLLERLQNPQRPIRQVILQTRLVIRASCGSAPVKNTGPVVSTTI
jgi:DNA-binding LacI/PurR family transcriptional regulator